MDIYQTSYTITASRGRYIITDEWDQVQHYVYITDRSPSVQDISEVLTALQSLDHDRAWSEADIWAAVDCIPDLPKITPRAVVSVLVLLSQLGCIALKRDADSGLRFAMLTYTGTRARVDGGLPPCMTC